MDIETEKRVAAIQSGLLNCKSTASNHLLQMQLCAILLAKLTSNDAKARESAEGRVLALAIAGGWQKPPVVKAKSKAKEAGNDGPPKIAGSRWKPEDISRVRALWAARSSENLQEVRNISAQMERTLLAIIIRLYLEGLISVEQGDAYCAEAQVRPLSMVAAVRKQHQAQENGPAESPAGENQQGREG